MTLIKTITFLLLYCTFANASAYSVVTYNVWFDQASSAERTPRLLNVIAQEQADIIALQEVESWFIDAIKQDDRFKQYHFSLAKGWFNHIKGGLLILSKQPVTKQHYIDLPSQLNRGLLLIETNVNKASLCIVTVHLESFLEDTSIRINQLNSISKETTHCQNLVLLGDFNFGDGEAENTIINPDYRDVWQKLKANYHGYTWNIRESSLARKNSFPSEGSRRLDKVYLKGDLLSAKTIQIIGQQGFKTSTGNTLFPSDHFGLSVKFVIARPN